MLPSDPVEVIKEVGLDSTFKLSMACADFYLLERMASDRFVPARRKLDILTRQTAEELEKYLDMAVGGELRHAISRDSPIEIPRPLFDYLMTAKNELHSDRTRCWAAWARLQREEPETAQVRLAAAQKVFDHPAWGKNSRVGGKLWGIVCRVLIDYRTGRMRARTFVDRCWTLEHNFGCVFDKVYKVHDMQTVLELQAEDRYDSLSRFASAEVRRLWQSWQFDKRGQFDPVWLGV